MFHYWLTAFLSLDGCHILQCNCWRQIQQIHCSWHFFCQEYIWQIFTFQCTSSHLNDWSSFHFYYTILLRCIGVINCLLIPLALQKLVNSCKVNSPPLSNPNTFTVHFSWFLANILIFFKNTQDLQTWIWERTPMSFGCNHQHIT